MENKKVIPLWLSVVLVLLCGATVAVNFAWMVTIEHAPVDIFAIALDILVVLLAISYFVYGYRKDAAVFYRLFSSIFMCSKIFVLPVVMTAGLAPSMLIILRVFECAFAIALGVGRDLGKKVSLALVWAIAGIEVINAIGVYMNAAVFSDQLFVLTRAGGVVIAAIFVIMTIAKYRDKTSRGTV